jgi:hypothetical protein
MTNRPTTALAVLLLACQPGQEAATVPGPAEVLIPPAAAGAGEPFLAQASDGGILLSWIETTSDSAHALRYARFREGRWSEAHTIAAGADWFVNWADFPSLTQLPDGSLAAHWLQRSAPSGYAYDVWVSHSPDGVVWSAPARPHADATATEHGFVTLFPHDGGLGMVWLDGRQYAEVNEEQGGHGGEMSLRFTVLRDSAVVVETELDGRTCDCCQTAVASTAAGPVVFYRDRSPDEVRDIAVTRLVEGVWTAPSPVHRDGWQIDACPVNGPAAVGSGREVAVAWFTAARDTPRVLVAFSSDAGAHFGAPVRIDDGDPLGRVAIAAESPGTVWVSWLEAAADGARIRVRRVTSSGSAPAVTMAEAGAGRATGFPRLLLHDSALWTAWTDEHGIRVLRARLGPLHRP